MLISAEFVFFGEFFFRRIYFLKRNIDKAYIIHNKKLNEYDDVNLAFEDIKKIMTEGNSIEK